MIEDVQIDRECFHISHMGLGSDYQGSGFPRTRKRQEHAECQEHAHVLVWGGLVTDFE